MKNLTFDRIRSDRETHGKCSREVWNLHIHRDGLNGLPWNRVECLRI